jgi:hypothetical protein
VGGLYRLCLLSPRLFPKVKFAQFEVNSAQPEFGMSKAVRAKIGLWRIEQVRLGSEKDKIAGTVFNNVRRLADKKNE